MTSFSCSRWHWAAASGSSQQHRRWLPSPTTAESLNMEILKAQLAFGGDTVGRHWPMSLAAAETGDTPPKAFTSACTVDS